MAEEEDDDLIGEPEMPAISTSEIEGAVCTTLVGEDGVPRPIFINQFEEDVLALTYEDALRLREFLDVAIKFVEEYKNRNLQ